MKNRSVTYILIALYLVLVLVACTNGSFDVMKENRTWTLTGIEVAGSLSEPFYFADDDLSSSLTVTATYSDREPRTVTGFTHNLATKIGLNQTSVTISYTEGGITKTAEVSGSFHVAKAEARPTEKPKALSGYTGTLENGTYYIFGDFPQTVAPRDPNGNELNDYTPEPIYRGYYLGSDGYFYEKCKENAYPNVASYKYSDGTTVARASANSEKYFKVEPIKWRALIPNPTGNNILLAESILTADIPYYGSTKMRNNNIIFPNNYEHSNIRAYLNGISYQSESGTDNTWENSGFLQIAFTEKAQKLIATTDVDNSVASTIPDEVTQEDLDRDWNGGRNDYPCGNTNDKIFLLSEKEATTKDYGFTAYNVSGSGNSRIRKTTDYALANYAWKKSDIADYSGWWWLRSPDYYSSTWARSIDSDGHAFNRIYVYNGGGGVVPALSIPASSLQ